MKRAGSRVWWALGLPALVAALLGFGAVTTGVGQSALAETARGPVAIVEMTAATHPTAFGAAGGPQLLLSRAAGSTAGLAAAAVTREYHLASPAGDWQRLPVSGGGTAAGRDQAHWGRGPPTRV